MKKPVSALTREDMRTHPVWEFLPETKDRDETWVRSVSCLPVTDLSGRLAATTLRLASGREVPAILGNISLQNALKTKHFLTVIAFGGSGQTFELARYHDLDAAQRSPKAFAEFLGVSEAGIFPMTYDISPVAIGLPEVVFGQISRDPEERLTEDQLINMAIE